MAIKNTYLCKGTLGIASNEYDKDSLLTCISVEHLLIYIFNMQIPTFIGPMHMDSSVVLCIVNSCNSGEKYNLISKIINPFLQCMSG